MCTDFSHFECEIRSLGNSGVVYLYQDVMDSYFAAYGSIDRIFCRLYPPRRTNLFEQGNKALCDLYHPAGRIHGLCQLYGDHFPVSTYPPYEQILPDSFPDRGILPHRYCISRYYPFRPAGRRFRRIFRFTSG